MRRLVVGLALFLPVTALAQNRGTIADIIKKNDDGAVQSAPAGGEAAPSAPAPAPPPAAGPAPDAATPPAPPAAPAPPVPTPPVVTPKAAPAKVEAPVARDDAPDTITGANAEPHGDESLEGGPSVAELISSKEFADSEMALVEIRSRWALRQLLQLGFAQTETPDRAVASALEHATPDEIGFTRDDAWLIGFERSVAVASLRPFTAHQAARVSAAAYDIPITDHALVDAWIDYFTGKGRWFFERWLGRSERYIPMMQPILESYGIPKDLVYLAMIESGFSAKAYSIAAASGYWQFIRGTAKTYGMRMDSWTDERRDYIIATHAAARYLLALYKIFGDWQLAWAGYNAGEGRIIRALKKTGAHTFWELVEQGALPRETQHYVPKIIAAAIVAKNKERYGFAGYDALKPLSYEEIQVNEALDMKLVAKELQVDVEVLHELNPQLIYDITPPGRAFTVRVPVGSGSHIKTWAENLPPAQRLVYASHKIARGETLSAIAAMHGTNAQMIQDFNHLKSARSLRVGQELIIPTIVTTGKGSGPKSPVPPPSASDIAKLAQVTQGGTPTNVIADGSQPAAPVVSKMPARTQESDANDAVAAAIVARAGTREPITSPSSVLPKAKPTPPPAPVTPPKGKPSTHVVESGDTLWSISQRYNTTVANLRSWNGIRRNNIKVGDKLKIYTQ